MLRSSEPGEQTYCRLKADLMHGRLEPNARLDFAALAAAYEVSTTPVREAAMRLFGERLLEPHPRAGLRPTLLTPVRLSALLETHRRLIETALRFTDEVHRILTPTGSATTIEQRTRLMFRAVMQASGNDVFVELIENLADRLAAVRTHELNVLPNADMEIAHLVAARSDRASLARHIRRYHARRIKNVEFLAWRAIATNANALTDPLT